MDSFSWSDSFQAVFGPCLACLHRPPRLESDDELETSNPNRRVHSDELEGLLADSDDAETLSLHSHIGDREHRRKKKPKSKKTIKFFGYDLFGRPPIHLTDDEDDVQGERGSTRRDGWDSTERQRTISSSSMDAAPLDPRTIQQISAAQQLATKAAAEEEERRAKEERRRRRREKKELKKAALAMALEQADDGLSHGHIPSPFRRSTFEGSDISSTAVSSPAPYDDFGPFEQAQAIHGQLNLDEDDADFDGADFGGASYARRTGTSNSAGTGSDSRSRTSGSNADASRYNHHYLSQEVATVLPHSPLEFPVTADQPKKKKRKSKSANQSNSTTSQSASIPSPPPEQSTFAPVVVSQETQVAPAAHDFPTTKLGGGGFPSTGLRGPGMHRKNSEAGVFLARRGDE